MLALGGALVAFAAVGMWGYVLNHDHTGKLLGHGSGRIENTTSPSWPGTGVTALFLVYETMDRAVLTNPEVHWLAAIGIAGAIAAGAWALMRRRRGEAASEAAGVALPFVSALLVIGAGWVLSWLSDRWGHPIRRPKGIVGPLNSGSNEDTSAFGPLGAVLMYALPLLTIAAVARGRFDARRVALAASVPLFVLLLVLESKWNEFLTRFLVVPVVLGAPLLAYLFGRRLATISFAAVASFVGLLTIAHATAKPLSARPWNFTQVRALEQAQNPEVATALAPLPALGAAAGVRGRRARARRAGVPALRPGPPPPRRVPAGDGRGSPGAAEGALLRRDQHRARTGRRRRTSARPAGTFARSGRTGCSRRSRTRRPATAALDQCVSRPAASPPICSRRSCWTCSTCSVV